MAETHLLFLGYTISMILIFTVLYYIQMQSPGAFLFGVEPTKQQGTLFDAFYVATTNHSTVGNTVQAATVKSQALVTLQMLLVIIGSVGVWVLPIEKYFPSLLRFE